MPLDLSLGSHKHWLSKLLLAPLPSCQHDRKAKKRGRTDQVVLSLLLGPERGSRVHTNTVYLSGMLRKSNCSNFIAELIRVIVSRPKYC